MKAIEYRSKQVKVRKVNSIAIIGRRWFDKQAGSTYHSTTILINGMFYQYIPFTYGYEDHYQQTARQVLESNGYLNGIEDNEALWQFCEKKNIKLYCTVADVSHRKDL
jgi:hypothetical protein